MCGRFILDYDFAKIVGFYEQFIKINNEEDFDYRNGEIFPTDKAIILNKNGLLSKEWGVKTEYSKGVIFNSRFETMDEKPLFKKYSNENRVIIPTNGFFEWSLEFEKKKKTKYLIKQDGILSLAGFLVEYDNKESFVIITIPSNGQMKNIHHRMPLMLSGDVVKNYLYDTITNKELLQISNVLSDNLTIIKI
jgi:putative SOS response-associated peptidase YedK